MVVKIPNRGYLKECKNWRGVALLPMASKVAETVIERILKSEKTMYLERDKLNFERTRAQ